jgi:hypothetical protein
MPSPPLSPPGTCTFDAGLDALLLETRDENKYAFLDTSTSTFTPGRFGVIDRTSSLKTRVRGEDDHVWYSTS